MRYGYIQIYTGWGKGKSTSAAGLVLRACGANLKVALFRFFKTKNLSSEDKILKKIKNLKIFYPEFSSLVFSRNANLEKIKSEQKKLFEIVKKEINNYNLIVLDEALDLIKYKIISTDEFLNLLKKRNNTEIVITGHYLNRKLKKIAHLITEFKKVKHYYDKGIKARKGIEF
jgi:cob(I)alamin adenosyltransferase